MGNRKFPKLHGNVGLKFSHTTQGSVISSFKMSEAEIVPEHQTKSIRQVWESSWFTALLQCDDSPIDGVGGTFLAPLEGRECLVGHF